MIRCDKLSAVALLGGALLLGACGDDDDASETVAPRAFKLAFAAQAGGQAVDCTTEVTGLGPDGTARVGLSDLRFYVSNLKLWDAAGAEVPVTFDRNEFQYGDGVEQVTLIDLTGNTEGTCAQTSIAFAEGTARTNNVVAGSTRVDQVKRVTFDVGVPQAMMRKVIASGTVESAPSPLNEMYWSWASGYRHFVLNVAVNTPAGQGDGYLHLGSRDCGPTGGLALEDRDQCTFVNTPKVSLDIASLDQDVVTLDLAAVFQGLDFKKPIRDPETFEEIGEGVGVECHSSPMQTDCAAVFSSFGLDMTTGAANPASDVLFSVKR